MVKSNFNGLKSFVSVALLTATILTQSCKKSDLPKEETVSPDELQQLKSFVSSSTGLPVTSVAYNTTKKYFIAGNDIVISLANARQRLKNTEISPASTERTGQRVYTYTATQTNASNIAIYADAAVTSDWLAALDQLLLTGIVQIAMSI